MKTRKIITNIAICVLIAMMVALLNHCVYAVSSVSTSTSTASSTSAQTTTPSNQKSLLQTPVNASNKSFNRTSNTNRNLPTEANNKSVCSKSNTCTIATNISKKETYPVKVKNEEKNKGNETELKVKEKTEEMRNSNKTEIMQKIIKMMKEQKRMLENISNKNETMLKNKEMVEVKVIKRTTMILEMLANLTENKEVKEKLINVARQCNETAINVQKAEEKIEKRSKIMKILFGGDTKAAKELIKEKERLQEQIQILENILNQTQNIYEREIIMDQINNLQKEMEQIQKIAQQQEQEKGILGWIFRL